MEGRRGVDSVEVRLTSAFHHHFIHSAGSAIQSTSGTGHEWGVSFCACCLRPWPWMLLTFSGAPVVAHGGGLDVYGGHRDSKQGNYHAHQGTCSCRTFASKDAAIKAGCRR